jgi:hypothetical protein
MEALMPRPPRITAFAKSFKNYMGAAAIVTAALPIPVTHWKLIPVFDAQSGILKVYTPLLCILIFTFVFYSRHWLGRLIFGSRLRRDAGRKDPGTGRAIVAFLPLFLIFGTVLSIIGYHKALNDSVGILLQQAKQVATEKVVLATTERYSIPNGSQLTILYILIFVFSELAFVLMALKEHLQDVMKFTEEQLLRGVQSPPSQRKP